MKLILELVNVCFSRSGDVVEYLMKDQWFVSCREMADKAVEVEVFLFVYFTFSCVLCQMLCLLRSFWPQLNFIWKDIFKRIKHFFMLCLSKVKYMCTDSRSNCQSSRLTRVNLLPHESFRSTSCPCCQLCAFEVTTCLYVTHVGCCEWSTEADSRSLWETVERLASIYKVCQHLSHVLTTGISSSKGHRTVVLYMVH